MLLFPCWYSKQDGEYEVYNQHAYNDLTNMNLQGNPAFVDPYLKKSTVDGHEMNSIMKLSWAEISPTTYGLLHNCQATSVSVWRSFWCLVNYYQNTQTFCLIIWKIFISSLQICHAWINDLDWK